MGSYRFLLFCLWLLCFNTATWANPLNNPSQLQQLNQQLQQAYQLYQDGQLEHAKALYQTLQLQQSNNVDVLLALGLIAHQQQQPMQAIAYFSQVLTHTPEQAIANAQLALLSGKTEQQESLLKYLLQLREHPSLYFALGNVYAAQQRWSEAEHSYRQANKLAPQQTSYQLNLAISLDKQGLSQQAIPHYQQVLASSGIATESIQQRLKVLHVSP